MGPTSFDAERERAGESSELAYPTAGDDAVAAHVRTSRHRGELREQKATAPAQGLRVPPRSRRSPLSRCWGVATRPQPGSAGGIEITAEVLAQFKASCHAVALGRGLDKLDLERPLGEAGHDGHGSHGGARERVAGFAPIVHRARLSGSALGKARRRRSGTVRSAEWKRARRPTATALEHLAIAGGRHPEGRSESTGHVVAVAPSCRDTDLAD